MSRQIIKINEETCVGCGLCTTACHLGIIGLVDGKAKLLRPDVCDGLGRCLPNCPTGSISFQQVEEEELTDLSQDRPAPAFPATCPGTGARVLERPDQEGQSPPAGETPAPFGGCPGTRGRTIETATPPPSAASGTPSQLRQWPVQIKLVPVNAPYFDGANLLIAADCTAYAYGDFHRELMGNKITLIGCPKLDEGSYAEKLTEIIRRNNLRSVTVARMEVPCCGGIENAVKTALQNSGKLIPWRVVTISTDGRILDDGM